MLPYDSGVAENETSDPAPQKPKAAKTAAAAHSRGDASPQEAAESRRYEREYLIEMGGALLNTEPPIVAGALALKPDRKEFTLVEAEDLVKTFIKRPIEPEEASA